MRAVRVVNGAVMGDRLYDLGGGEPLGGMVPEDLHDVPFWRR